MTPLDRRCARLARLYRDPARRAEVATTLAEANAGRRGPRLGDVLDVLWHGAADRLGGSVPGTRFGRWGDAVAVAVVQALVMLAATAAAFAAHLFEKPALEYPVHPYHPSYGHPGGGPVFHSRAEAYAAAGAALLAVTAAAAACLTRVATARAAALLAAVSGAGSVAASRATGNEYTFATTAGRVLALGGVVVLAALVGTTAVARAGRAAPRSWWVVSAVVCGLAALHATVAGPHPFVGRSGGVLYAATTQSALLALLALPLVRRAPAALGGAAIVAAVVASVGLPLVQFGYATPLEASLLEAAAFAAPALVPVAAVAVWRWA